MIVIEIVRLKKPVVRGTRPGPVVMLWFRGGAGSLACPFAFKKSDLYGLIFIEVSRMKKPVAQGTSPGHW